MDYYLHFPASIQAISNPPRDNHSKRQHSQQQDSNPETDKEKAVEKIVCVCLMPFDLNTTI